MEALNTLFVITLTTLRVLFPGVPTTTATDGAANATRSMTMDLYTSSPPRAEMKVEVGVPESLGVGKSVVLHIDPKDYSKPEPEAAATQGADAALPRQLTYWGCAESVPTGQPAVVDPNKPAKADSKPDAVAVAVPALPDVPKGTFAYWPGRGDQAIRSKATAPGDYTLSADFGPEAFAQLGPKQDFLAAVEFEGLDREMDTNKALKLQWKPVPNARGYLLVAYGGSATETIEWISSSKRCDTSGLDITPVSDTDMAKLIEGGIVLPPDATSCTIPAGIFRGASSVVLSFTAFGHDTSQTRGGVTSAVLVRSAATVALLSAPQLFDRE